MVNKEEATMTELEKAVLHDTQQAIGEAIKINLTSYNSSFNKLVNEIIENHREELRKIIDESFTSTIKSKSFKESVNNAFNHKLARVLVSKLEGSVEKTVNTLRSDPTLRAKMVLAIEGIITEHQK